MHVEHVYLARFEGHGQIHTRRTASITRVRRGYPYNLSPGKIKQLDRIGSSRSPEDISPQFSIVTSGAEEEKLQVTVGGNKELPVLTNRVLEGGGKRSLDLGIRLEYPLLKIESETESIKTILPDGLAPRTIILVKHKHIRGAIRNSPLRLDRTNVRATIKNIQIFQVV